MRRGPVRAPDPGRVALIVLLLGVPVTFLGLNLGSQGVSGPVWALEFAVLLPLVLLNRVPRAALRTVLPYAVFLEFAAATLLWTPVFGTGIQTFCQLLVPALAYLAAWNVRSDLTPLIRRMAWADLVLGSGLSVGVVAGVVPDRLVSVRPTAIAIVGLFVLVATTTPSRRLVVLAGTLAVGSDFLTGSRTAALVAVLVLAGSRGLRLRRRQRLALLAALLLLVVGVTQTHAFRARVFYDPDTTVSEFLVGGASNQLNTSGRLEYWPRIYSDCATSAWRGKGLGAAFGIAETESDGSLTQPHNEFLRVFCETGVPGVVLFWGGVVVWGVVRARRRSRGSAEPSWSAASVQLLGALVLFGLTDNPLLYTGHFLAPLFFVLGLSDSATPVTSSGYDGRRQVEGRTA